MHTSIKLYLTKTLRPFDSLQALLNFIYIASITFCRLALQRLCLTFLCTAERGAYVREVLQCEKIVLLNVNVALKRLFVPLYLG